MLLALAALAAIAAPPAPAPTPFSDARPPVRFQGDATVKLEITDQAGIERACHPLFGAPPAGMKTDACQTGDRVILPNPCTFPESDRYAALLCHELAHANGWSRNHEREGTQLAGAPTGASTGTRPSPPRR